MSCNVEDAKHCSEGVAELMSCEDSLKKPLRSPKETPEEIPKKNIKKPLKKTLNTKGTPQDTLKKP